MNRRSGWATVHGVGSKESNTTEQLTISLFEGYKAIAPRMETGDQRSWDVRKGCRHRCVGLGALDR